MKEPRHVIARLLLLLAAIPSFVSGQAITFAPAQQQSPISQVQPADPFGRNTPRGTMTAFIRSVNRNDFVSAARYMQVTLKQKPTTEILARDLKELMDRYFSQPVASISNSPVGSLDDGLPLDQERIGPLLMGGGSADIILVRVIDPQSGPIWVISSETLAQVPGLYAAIEKTWIERVMPVPLVDHSFLGVSLAQWIAWGVSLIIPFASLWLISRFLIALAKRFIRNPIRIKFIELRYTRIRWPLIVVLTLGIHMACVPILGFSLSFRIIYTRIALVALALAVAWLLHRISTLLFERARIILQRRGQTNTESLMLLAERMFKVLVTLVAIFIILTIIGVDTKTALAGVGLGGVAVALGAQKTVENLLGGIFLLTDNAIAIGDTCCISNRLGTVEDITLRSVRLRTLEQTLLSIPAGALSQANIENLTSRMKILIQTNILLRYGATTDQIKLILEEIQKSLEGNPQVESETARIRLINFGMQAIELELFAYILTPAYERFLTIRQELLLQIATIVESAGSSFARPTEFIYLHDNLRRQELTPPEESVENEGSPEVIARRAS